MNITKIISSLAINRSAQYRFASFFKEKSIARSYYEILEVKPNASEKEIKKNFLKKGRNLFKL